MYAQIKIRGEAFELSTLEQKILNIQLGYFLCIFMHVFVFKICIFIFVHNKLLRNKLFDNNYVHVQCILSHPMTAKLIHCSAH